MRLIDADKLSARLSRNATPYFTVSDIENAPTIDVVPVIRCWECKHLNVVNRKELYAHCPKTNTVFLLFELDTREHFCSLGERKEGAD